MSYYATNSSLLEYVALHGLRCVLLEITLNTGNVCVLYKAKHLRIVLYRTAIFFVISYRIHRFLLWLYHAITISNSTSFQTLQTQTSKSFFTVIYTYVIYQHRAFSLPGQIAPWSKSANRTMDNSLCSPFVPWPIRSLAHSLPRTVTPGNDSSALFRISPQIRVRVSVSSVRISYQGLFLEVYGQNGDRPKRRQSKRRQTKTATNCMVKTATPCQPKRRQTKMATNCMVKTATTIGLFVMFLLCLSVYLR